MDPRLQLVTTAAIALIGNAIAVYTIISSKQDKFKSAIDTKFDTVIKENSNKFEILQAEFNKMALQLTKLLEGDLKLLQLKLERFETGQDEWTKTLRERTHSLAGDLHNFIVHNTEMKGELNVLKSKVEYLTSKND